MEPIAIVKCQFCGKLLKTRGTNYFKCCGIAQSIKSRKCGDGISLKKVKKEPKKGEFIVKRDEFVEKTGKNEQKVPIID